jgi:uncharacterized protein (TIGR02453 family)
MASDFTGFPKEAISFFRALRRNNAREWFQARKAVYEESVRAPMVRLVEAINADLMTYAPEYVTDPKDAIYRIYRDTRFSPDKTPYKTHIAALFPRRGMAKHFGSGFYFSVSDKEIEVAGGAYMPGPEQLLSIRKYLSEHHMEFRKLLQARTLKTLMGDLQGQQLSRPPKGFCSEHPAADLVRYKQLYLDALLDPACAMTSAVFDEVRTRFGAMAAFVNFLNRPLLAAKKESAKKAPILW